ncbi:C2H2-type domain-containing protein [Caenorhabditis elegans]|uniref:C2H2-type domain-containing protein n=2 Tax=Caenorhabditis elegans TaxID=6239 RepID=B1V8K4_CAEEL|nr:C2H2-type domain-containing protein [Caenorhabditis elegans]CAQ35075.1 C2H2-type domain-containing protein [Caenorhabditis elegans]|eukprot:NP_001122547.1 Uncharacterized protein CELE_Y53H1A.2 [Caenorhabditis elegans]
MATMTERKQDFSCPNYMLFGDDFNLQSGIEDISCSSNYTSDEDGPKVLTTMRNMFAEQKTDEYELVYDNNSQNVPQNCSPKNQYSPPQSVQQAHYSNLSHFHPRNPEFSQEIVENRVISPKSEHPEEIEDHEDDEDGQSEMKHNCPECPKKYTSERRLKHHIVVHRNPDAYKCQKCGYCYQSPDSLRRHWKKTPNCDEFPPKINVKTEILDPDS